ncbi:MAG TPA: 5-(carboxyamino)imidazole ribonucleotide synthase [Afifellaceae bacterium]|nr:5-(carboxyamino)imidazole ribonucleotide synthase [Afifellaceae bacterium]
MAETKHPTDTGIALAPGSTIGILGGGQLGRMLALAAAPLGLKCHIYCPDADSPAFDVAAAHTVAAYEDEDALDRFAGSVDAVTYEFENIDLAAVERLATRVPVRPNVLALAISQDRLAEKTFLADAGIAVAPVAAVGSLAELNKAIAAIGRLAVLKTRRLGYDGKGQVSITEDTDLAGALAQVGGAASIVEGFVDFAKEVSVIAVRGANGAAAAYDVAENVHREHILHTSTVPAAIRPETAAEARLIAERIMKALDYIGVLGVEFFVVEDDGREALLVNEIAPRVHNSGHWTQDACAVSQFENHIRAVAGWPLGPTGRHADAVMTNLIGAEADAWDALAGDPAARLHLYGKSESRPGRKMGHVNRLGPLTR